jgi:hypothetical protein
MDGNTSVDTDKREEAGEESIEWLMTNNHRKLTASTVSTGAMFVYGLASI